MANFGSVREMDAYEALQNEMDVQRQYANLGKRRTGIQAEPIPAESIIASGQIPPPLQGKIQPIPGDPEEINPLNITVIPEGQPSPGVGEGGFDIRTPPTAPPPPKPIPIPPTGVAQLPRSDYLRGNTAIAKRRPPDPVGGFSLIEVIKRILEGGGIIDRPQDEGPKYINPRGKGNY